MQLGNWVTWDLNGFMLPLRQVRVVGMLLIESTP